MLSATLIQEVLTAGLRDEHRGNLDEPATDAEFTELFEFACEQRVTGLLVLAIERACVAVRADQRAKVIDAHNESLRTCQNLESMLLDVHDLFAAAQIDMRVLKGPAVARRFYPDRSIRTFGDIDLLVRSRDWDPAAALLIANGFSRRYREPRPGFTARFGKGACFVGPDKLEVDLHRTFVDGSYGFAFDPDLLFEQSQDVIIETTHIATLSDPLLAVHSAVHAALGNRPARSAPLRDLFESIEAGVAPHSIVETAEAMNLSYPVCYALQIAHDRLGISCSPELQAWSANYRPTRREQSALDSYTATHRRYARQVLNGVSSTPGLTSKLRYIAALAAPDRSYLAERDGSVARRLKRALSISRRSKEQS